MQETKRELPLLSSDLWSFPSLLLGLAFHPSKHPVCLVKSNSISARCLLRGRLPCAPVCIQNKNSNGRASLLEIQRLPPPVRPNLPLDRRSCWIGSSPGPLGRLDPSIPLFIDHRIDIYACISIYPEYLAVF